MAGVYVARASGVAGFERLFALKVLHPHLAHEEEFISMFLDEARLAARIRHPNVVPTTDISDTPDAGYYLVMDYIEGDHFGALLQTAFKQGSNLPIELTLRIVTDALNGLAAAHAVVDDEGRPLNLVHRDISPHNVMVSTDGVSRITDFGVAKSEVRLSNTKQGQFKGKLAYMAPEHASSGQADQRSDLFAMAIILWEALTGRRLFKSENHAATLNKICLEPIPAPSEVAEELAPFDALLARGLAREPEDRFQTAEEFADELEEVAATNGGLANHRVVAKLVREYAREKLEKDKSLIREGIALVAENAENEASVSGPIPAANPVQPVAETEAQAEGREPSGAVVTAGGDGMLAHTSAAPAPDRTGLIIGLGLTIVALAIGFAILATGDDAGAGVTTQTLPGSNSPVTAAPVAAPTPSPVQPEAPTAAPAAAEQPAVADGEEAGPNGQTDDEAAGAEEASDEAAAQVEEPAPRKKATRTKRKARKSAGAGAKAKTKATAKAKSKAKAKAKAKASDDLLFNPYR